MKKLFAMLLVCLTVFTACEPVSEEVPSSITLTSNSDVKLNSGSAMGIITYTINIPVAGYEVKAVANVEWINSFDYSQMGKIGYKVDANPTYEPREAVVTLSYGSDSLTINFTQKGMERPEEVNIEAPYLLGHYYGDYANNGNYNYYLVFSESNYDSTGGFQAAGYKYFLDIYSTERAADYNNIRVPDGVYTFNPRNDGEAGTFLESFSIYKEYDINGMEVGEKKYKTGALTVEGNNIKLELTFEDENKIYIVTYTGDYDMKDMRSSSGGIY